MIQSREDINNLLSNYLDTRSEYVQAFHTKLENWNGHKLALYCNGVVLGKVREKDELTMEILRWGVSDKTLKDEIKQALNAESQRDIKGSLSNVGVPFKSSTTDGRECFFLTSFFIVVLHEIAIESVFGIC